jgi:hypothetical protein
MTEQAIALQLADAIWPWPGISSLADGQARKLSQAAAELRRLHEVEQQRDELLAALRNMVEMFKNVPTLEQNSFDEPPEPRTQWDYEAYQMIGAACAAIAKAEGA